MQAAFSVVASQAVSQAPNLQRCSGVLDFALITNPAPPPIIDIQMDAAILVVDYKSGLKPQTFEHVLLARQVHAAKGSKGCLAAHLAATPAPL
jgi:hypothetical protein